MAITDQMVIPPSGNISIMKADGRHVLAAQRPQFSFQYQALKYLASVQEYMLNGQIIPMTPEQVQEVGAFLANIEPSPELSIKVAENYRNRKFLADTDWYVIRKMETGVEIPQDITQARATARAAIHTI